MSFLNLPSNPPPNPSPDSSPAPVKLRSSRYGELEEHELIRLLDTIDDERARARFRESVYISLFVWIFVAWFAIYGPRVLWHQPRLVNPADILKQRELTQLNAPPTLSRAIPRRPSAAASRPDTKTLERMRAEAPKPTPAPPPPPPPPETATTTPLPPVAPPPPPTPQPRQPIPDAPAPSPNIFGRDTSAGSAIRAAESASARNSSGSGRDIPSSPSHFGRATAGPGISVLSDLQGWDPSAYLRRLHDVIQNNWEPLLPESIQPPISEKGITGIRFTILPNGDLSNPILESRSGEHALDVAAWAAIRAAGFPPLPKEFHGPNLELRVGFYVNEPLPSH